MSGRWSLTRIARRFHNDYEFADWRTKAMRKRDTNSVINDGT